MQKGYFQIYTGDGKGKTTAALGLALRAAGAELRVYFAQFIKSNEYSELRALRRFVDLIEIRQFGQGRFIHGKPSAVDIEEARNGLEEITAILAEGLYDIVILDEAAIALHFNLFEAGELLDAIRHRNPHVEVIVTGRRAPQCLLDAADLVTEMRELKHYYNYGVSARAGIEK